MSLLRQEDLFLSWRFLDVSTFTTQLKLARVIEYLYPGDVWPIAFFYNFKTY